MSKLPGRMWEGIPPTPELDEIQDIVLEYFEGDVERSKLWFRLSNPMLGEVSPLHLLWLGREKKVLQFARASRDANRAANVRLVPRQDA